MHIKKQIFEKYVSNALIIEMIKTPNWVFSFLGGNEMGDVILLTDADKLFGNVLAGIVATFTVLLLVGFAFIGFKVLWQFFKMRWDELNE